MGCPELDMTSYFRFVRPDENPHERLESPTEKTSYSRFSRTVVSIARYYSPELGRWISRDPIQEKGGWNLYGMCRNNPVYFIDRLGNDVIAIALTDLFIPEPTDIAAPVKIVVYAVAIAAELWMAKEIVEEMTDTDEPRVIPYVDRVDPIIPKGDICKCLDRTNEPAPQMPSHEDDCIRYQLVCKYLCYKSKIAFQKTFYGNKCDLESMKSILCPGFLFY